MKNKKGFTLIELLAVIIILGLLMLIAIPSVTAYIDNSRKNSYIDTAKEYIKGATNFINSGEIDAFDPNVVYYIPVSCISLETGGNSPYGSFDDAYIAVTYDNDSFKYYWVGTDSSSMGIKELTGANDLSTSSIEAGVKKNDLDEDPGLRKTNRFYNNDCTLYEDKPSEKIRHNLSFGGEPGTYVRMTPTETSFTAYGTEVNVSEINLWRVLRNNSDGTVELIADKASGYFDIPGYNNITDYLNYVDIINGFADHFKNTKYTIRTREVGYNGQTLRIDPNNFNIPSGTFVASGAISTEPTIDNSKEAYGNGDVMYQSDLDLINSVYGTLQSSNRSVYFLASREKNVDVQNAIRWFWGPRVIDTDGSLSFRGLVNRCTTTCAVYGAAQGTLRPIITMKANIAIASGTGTKADPFILE